MVLCPVGSGPLSRRTDTQFTPAPWRAGVHIYLLDHPASLSHLGVNDTFIPNDILYITMTHFMSMPGQLLSLSMYVFTCNMLHIAMLFSPFNIWHVWSCQKVLYYPYVIFYICDILASNVVLSTFPKKNDMFQCKMSFCYIMKIYNYERIFLLKKYAHNVTQYGFFIYF